MKDLSKLEKNLKIKFKNIQNTNKKGEEPWKIRTYW